MNPKLIPLLAITCGAALGACAQDEAPKTVILTQAGQPTGLRLPVSYTAPDKGFVSLALFDAKGVLIRSLLYAQAVEKGKATVEWDGTTDLGLPAAAGNYTAKGIFFKEPPKVDFVMKVGKSGNPPYRTPDGTGDWGANLSEPTSVVANSKNLIMGWGCVEDNQITGIEQTDADGNIQMRYFSFYPWDGRMAAAIDEKNYYLGIFNGQTFTTEIAEYTLGTPRGRILAKLPVTAQPKKTQDRWNGRLRSNLDGLALTPDTVYASVAQENAIFLVNRADGKIRQKIDVPSPKGIAITGDRLLVVSEDQLLEYNLTGQPRGPLIESRLKNANAIALDKTGNIYLGASATDASQGGGQVLVFDPTGKSLRKIGDPAGSPSEGKFNATGLGKINALAIGPKGDLFVQDVATGFKRTTRWSVDGKQQQQWFARKLQHVADEINPAHPDLQISARNAFDDSPPGIYAYNIDIAKKTWSPAWFYELTYDRIYGPAKGVYLSHQHPGNPLKAVDRDLGWPIFDYPDPAFVTYKGRDYMMSGTGNGDGTIFTYSANSSPKPVALIGFHRVEKTGGVLQAYYDQGPNNWFTWADLNGDGKMQTEETIFIQNPAALQNAKRVSSARLEPNMDIRLKLGNADAILPLKELRPDGIPVYDWSQLKPLAQLAAPDFTGGDGKKNVRGVSLPVPFETEDGIYGLADPTPATPLRLPGIDGDGWWASRNWRKKIVKWNKQTGAVEWAVGRRAPGRAKPGEMYNPIMIGGVAGNAIFAADAMSVEWVWDTGGFYLGRLYNDTGAGIADSNSVYNEQQGTAIYTDTKTGKIYSMANDVGGFIHEVTLPVRTSLTGSAVTLTPALASQIQPWDPDGLSPLDKPAFTATYTAQPPQIDGLPDGREWQNPFHDQRRPEGTILLDGEAVSTFRVQWDDKNLYLAYRVRDKNGPINSGSELPYGPFVSGAYVDFTLGPNWTGPRDEVRDGDVRILLSRVKDGEDWKLFHQGFWQKKAGGAHPQTITSPAAEIKMDDITEIPGFQAGYKVSDRDQKYGLFTTTIEVAVPLAAIGLTDPAGKTIGFDVSVGVANAAGDRRERAAHWAGLSEGVVVDRPGSIKLLPHTWGTLTFAK